MMQLQNIMNAYLNIIKNDLPSKPPPMAVRPPNFRPAIRPTGPPKHVPRKAPANG